jgi:hypothetical protein
MCITLRSEKKLIKAICVVPVFNVYICMYMYLN